MVSTVKSVKSFVVVFVLIITLGSTIAVFLRLRNEKNMHDEVEGKIQTEYTIIPKIVNIPARSVAVGSEFVFVPRVVPKNNENKLSLVESPEWLEINDDVISGIPNREGSYTFVLRVEREGKYTEQEFYLVVTGVENE
jgi:hypothetical protein